MPVEAKATLRMVQIKSLQKKVIKLKMILVVREGLILMVRKIITTINLLIMKSLILKVRT